FFPGLVLAFGRFDRQTHLEHGPPRLGVDADLAAVAIHHDAPGDVEPETGALADILRRVARLERARRHRRRHACAGVADLDAAVARVSPGHDLERADAFHRVDRVVDQVGPHLVELTGVRLDPGDLAAVLALDLDAVAELVAQHHQRALQAVGHIDL